MSQGPAYTDQSAVAQSPISAGPEEHRAREAGMTRDMLLAALTHFPDTDGGKHRAREAAPFQCSAPGIANSYEIELKYYGDGEWTEACGWQIIDAGSGDLVKSGLDQVDAAWKNSRRRYATSL